MLLPRDKLCLADRDVETFAVLFYSRSYGGSCLIFFQTVYLPIKGSRKEAWKKLVFIYTYLASLRFFSKEEFVMALSEAPTPHSPPPSIA
jgi:hypothetical protein